METVSDHRYFKFKAVDKYLIDSLVKSTLWFAKPDTLNDPFDCQLDLVRSWKRAAASASGRRSDWLRHALEIPDFLGSVTGAIQQVGVCSFALNLDTPISTSVLWSHYADKHRGVCLSYRFPESFLLDPKNMIVGVDKVFYDDNALTKWLEGETPTEMAGFTEGLIKIYLTAKSPAWKDENEVRIIRHDPGPFDIPFGFLEQVCFGLQTPLADILLVEKVAREHCGCRDFCRIIRDEKSDFGIKAVEL